MTTDDTQARLDTEAAEAEMREFARALFDTTQTDDTRSTE